jgi:hypothetical protein
MHTVVMGRRIEVRLVSNSDVPNHLYVCLQRILALFVNLPYPVRASQVSSKMST